jgi:hypothetical protein
MGDAWQAAEAEVRLASYVFGMPSEANAHARSSDMTVLSPESLGAKIANVSSAVA